MLSAEELISFRTDFELAVFELCFALGSKGSTQPSLSRHFAGRLPAPSPVFEFFPRGTRYFWTRRGHTPVSRQGYHRWRPWKGRAERLQAPAAGAGTAFRQLLHPSLLPPTRRSARPGSLGSRRPNKSSGAEELEPGGTSGRSHPGRGAGTCRGREMESVRSWGWAHGDEVPALGKLRARRGASGGKRGRVCSVRVSVFLATSAKFLGGRAPPPPGGLEKDPKAGLDFEHRGGGKGKKD